MSHQNLYLSKAKATAIIPATDGALELSSTFGERLSLGSGCESLHNYDSPATVQQTVEFFSLLGDGKFFEIYGAFMFGGVKVELKKLAITPAQFCVGIGKKSFQNGDLVLIQIEAEGDEVLFFVAYVFVEDDDSLRVRVFELADDSTWFVSAQLRVVVSQLEPMTP